MIMTIAAEDGDDCVDYAASVSEDHLNEDGDSDDDDDDGGDDGDDDDDDGHAQG